MKSADELELIKRNHQEEIELMMQSEQDLRREHEQELEGLVTAQQYEEIQIDCERYRL